MTSWKPYINDRLIKVHPTGFYVIKPADVESTTNISCEICKRMLRSSEDETASREFSCCYMCALRWAHPRRTEWKAGWRPSPEEITNELANRHGLSIHIKVD